MTNDDIPGLRCWLQVIRTYQKANHALTRQLSELELTVPQHEVLVNISRDEGMTQQSLANKLLVTKPNVSGLIGRLEARALVRRRDDPDDRRSKRLFLTANGRRLVARSLAVQTAMVEDMVSVLTPGEVSSLYEIMQRVAASVDEVN